jgi:E3 ubiquitin-protein ligase DMA1/2
MSISKSTHKRLQNLAKKKDSDTASVNSSECSICLMPIAPCQSLFVAPCSHVWHYKCIRPILNGHTWPNFLCPNCRAVADLEADVDEAADEWEEEDEVIEVSKKELKVTNVDAASLNSTRAVHRVPSRDHTPEAMDVQTIGHDTGEDLNVLMGLNNLALNQPSVETPSTSDESIPSAGEGADGVGISSHSLSTPRAIPSRNPSTSSAVVRETTPERTETRDVLLPITIGVEGPMTPRNDAGPFVLDGGAGRSSRVQQETQGES